MPSYRASGVRRSPSSGCPFFGHAVWVRYPHARGRAGVGTRYRPFGLRALLGRHAAGVVGSCPGGLLSRFRGPSEATHSRSPGRPSLGQVSGARCPCLLGARAAGMIAEDLPYSARSCELVLRAV